MPLTTISSPAASGVIRTATIPLHHAVITGESGNVTVLRIADVAAVAIAALKTVAPDVAARLPADIDVQHAQIGATDFDSRIVGLVHWVTILRGCYPFSLCWH